MQKTLIIDSPSLKQGFTAAPNAVLYDARLSVQARWLYCILLSFAWQENECWPGQERIAKVAGWHINTVEKYLKELRDFGLISWKRQGLNRPNIYYIHDPSKALELKDSQASVNPDSQGSVNPDSQASVILDSHARVKEEDSDEEDSVNNNVVVVYNPATSKTTGTVPGKAGQESVSTPRNSSKKQVGEQISLTGEIQKAFLQATGQSLPDKALEELASYPFEYVLSKIAMVEVGKEKMNAPGWLIEACREDYQHLPGPKQKRAPTRSKPPKLDSAKDDKYRELYRLV